MTLQQSTMVPSKPYVVHSLTTRNQIII
uniref:Uncharacterized protein n=1 Tax=Rhizophora mucronata TaxID=61149 RepID=A0A2P2Q127_RHIMU